MYNPTALIENPSPMALFPVNIWKLNTLFPGFAAGDFAVLHGSQSVISLISLQCVRAQLPTQLGGLATNVVFIEGANTFQFYQIVRLARLHQMEPEKVLKRILIVRAFTAHQMRTLIMQKLEETISKNNTKLVLISDIAATFLDKDIQDEEAKAICRQVTDKLALLAKQYQIIVIATYLPHQECQRNTEMQTMTQAKAKVIIGLHQSKHKRKVALEKHQSYALGSIEIQTEKTQLTDFIDP
jgi:hypothetical protein